MNLQEKTPAEIQAEIFNELDKGTSVEKIKQELQSNGHIPEGYYFDRNQHKNIVTDNDPLAPSSTSVSGKQVIITIILLIVLVFRIIRCSQRMDN